MKSTHRTLLAGAVFTLTAAASQAALIDTRPSGNTFNPQPFGETNTATYGQTITAPLVDTVLDTFTFTLNDFLNPDFVDFAGYVMAWDGAKATGPILYQSAMRTSTNNGGANGFEEFSFSTGGLALTAGSEYILFVSASDFFDGSFGTSMMGGSNVNAYSGGQFYFQNNGSNFATLTTDAWNSFGGGNVDAAFSASFSAPIPEPTTALFGLALLGVTTLRRRR